MRRYETRESRFSARALLTWASSSLPETLALKAAAAEAPAEILLYDEIGFWGVTASDFAAALSKAGDGPLTLRINSPGGDVFDGYAIYNMLKARKAPVAVVIDGLAASAASFIAMAGSSVTMGEASMLMIHNSWGMCVGDRNDMLDMAATQEKIDGQIAAIYAGKCGLSAAALATMMDDETWLTSTEALAQNFCDSVTNSDAQASAKSAAPIARAGKRLQNATIDPEDPEDPEDPDDPDQDPDDPEEYPQRILDKIGGAIGLLNEAQEHVRSMPRSSAAKARAASAQVERRLRLLRLAESL